MGGQAESRAGLGWTAWAALQTILMAAAGIAMHHYGLWLFLPIAVLWGVSLVWCGARLDAR